MFQFYRKKKWHQNQGKWMTSFITKVIWWKCVGICLGGWSTIRLVLWTNGGSVFPFPWRRIPEEGLVWGLLFWGPCFNSLWIKERFSLEHVQTLQNFGLGSQWQCQGLITCESRVGSQSNIFKTSRISGSQWQWWGSDFTHFSLYFLPHYLAQQFKRSL